MTESTRVRGRRSGRRSPTLEEVREHAPDQRRLVADLKARLGEAEAWLEKLRSALEVETNGHAASRARGLWASEKLRAARLAAPEVAR